MRHRPNSKKQRPHDRGGPSIDTKDRLSILSKSYGINQTTVAG